MRPCLLLAFLVLSASMLSAHEGDNWFFGKRCGVNFTTGAPVTLTNGVLDSQEGCASQSDKAGNLLFYTDGSFVYNKAHQVMSGGVALGGSYSSTQSSLVVPAPGDIQRYYIVTTDANENSYKAGVTYSIVDMGGSGGMGTVVQKNTPLLAPATEKLTAIRHANGTDVWLVAHALDTNLFYVWSVTAAGISATPTTFASGPMLMFGDIGYMKANQQGSRIAFASSNAKQLWLFDFNKTTGVVSNARIVAQRLDGSNFALYGVEFSPSGRFLYATRTDSNVVMQYDLSQPLPPLMFIVGSTTGRRAGALQLAPNGKIYMATEGIPFLAEIAAPDSRGLACGYRDKAVDLQGRVSEIGLPNFMPAIFLNEVTYEITADTACVGRPTSMRFLPDSGITNATWNFGDPASGANNRATGTRVQHVYARAGTYTVTVIYDAQGFTKTLSMQVVVNANPNVNAGFDVTICAGGSVKLQARGAVTYRWSPGNVLDDSTKASPLANILTTTTFIATGYNEFGCSDADTVTVFVTSFKATLDGPREICKGDTIILRAKGGGESYRWTRSDGPDITTKDSILRDAPTTSVNYRVIISTGVCVDSATLTVTVNPQPTVKIRPDTSVCAGSPVQLWASGGTTYQWSPTNGLDDAKSPTPIARPTAPTRYRVTVTTEYGCFDTASVFVGFGSIKISAAGDTSMCVGGTATLTTSGAESYAWRNTITNESFTGSTINVTPTQTTRYVVVGTSGACVDSTSVLVTISPSITVTVSADTTICEGGSVRMVASGADTYEWTPSTWLDDARSVTPTSRPPSSISYRVRGTSNGCWAEATVSITVIPAQTLRCSMTSDTVPSGAPAVITVARLQDENVEYPLRAHLFYQRGTLDLRQARDAVIVGTTTDGIRDDVELLITSGSEAGVLTVLTFDTFLNGLESVPLSMTFPAAICGSMVCDEGGRVNMTNCADKLRVVALGARAQISVDVLPNPVGRDGKVAWTSSLLGEHRLEIVNTVGDVLVTSTWHQTDGRLHTGTMPLAMYDLSAGVYVVRLTSSNGIATTIAVLQ
jgi:hypothetical protein